MGSPESVRRVQLGIAGLGRMGAFHADNAARSNLSDVVRVVDSEGNVARATAARLGVDWSTSYDDLVNDPEIEGVVIATPTPTHANFVRRAATSGKHILVEKPLATEQEAGDNAVEVAGSAGVLLQVGFHRRFDPDWSAAAERIGRGELGEVYLFRSSLREMQPPSETYLRASGDFFVDFTIHDFDVARWMVGEIEEVTAFAAIRSDPLFEELGQPDNALVVLRFTCGALGVIDNSRVAGYGYECSTELVGSRATTRIGYGQPARNVSWLADAGATVQYVTNFTERFQAAYTRELEHFAGAIRGEHPLAVTGEDATAAFALCQAASRSAREARTVGLRHEPRERGVAYRELDHGLQVGT